MVLLLAPLLMIAVVLYVAYPLLREDLPETEVVPQASERERLTSEKEQLISNIKDIEMDYQMRKLSEEDYDCLKSEFEMRAIDVLRRLDRLDTAQKDS